MYERHGGGSFPHSGCYALHASRSHIAHRKNAGETRLQSVRRPRQWPLRREQVIPGQVSAGLDESLVVTRQALIEPFRTRFRAGHDEQVANFTSLDRAGRPVTPGNRLEVTIALEFRDPGLDTQRYAVVVLDAPDEIPRHGVSQPA